MVVKTYLKYKFQDSFGVIVSPGLELLHVPGSKGKLIISAALEDVCIWNVRQGIIVEVLRDVDNKSCVTAYAMDPTGKNLAVGYADGSIRIWSLAKREVLSVFRGHTSNVSSLIYHPEGHLLFSGAADTDIVVWDVIQESGLYRLKGHKDEITDFQWLPVETQIPIEDLDQSIIQTALDTFGSLSPEQISTSRSSLILLSSSKDSTIKCWDLSMQHCMVTLSSQAGEIWSFDVMSQTTVDPETNQIRSASALLVAGGKDKFLRSWRLRTTLIAANINTEQVAIDMLFENIGVEFVGVMERPGGQKRVSRVRFNHAAKTSSRQNAGMLCVYGVEKHLEIYRVRNQNDRVQRQRRRFKRYREKIQSMEKKVEQRKITTQALADAKREVPPQYLPTDDLEICAPIRVDDKITNFAFCLQSVELTAQGKDLLIEQEAQKQLNNSQHFVTSTIFKQTYSALTENLSLSCFIGLSTNSIEQINITLLPSVKLQNETFLQNDRQNDESSAPVENPDATYKVKRAISLAGHRAPIRATALSSDDSLLVTVGGQEIKFWNMKSHSCLRTLTIHPATRNNSDETDDVIVQDSIVSCAFVPGNKAVLIGTKLGYIDLYEIASGLLLTREQLEPDTPVWGLDVAPDGKSFASTAGKIVAFWNLEMVAVTADEEAYFSSVLSSSLGKAGVNAQLKRKRLTFEQSRALQLTDEVLCIKHSPDMKFIACGLLDSTVRIFHVDSLNFYLSLYGHKLPVLTLDISDDNRFIITGSSDKSAKIWGLDFGDCHRSFHAHENSVMRVKFHPKTHFFSSIGKDGVIRIWDADRHKRIQTLPRQHSELFSLTVSSKGQYILTTSADKSISRFYQSDEVIIPDEEEENEILDDMVDSAIENTMLTTVSTSNTSNNIGQVLGGINIGTLTETEQVWAKSIRTKDVISLTEYLLDALEHCKNEMKNWNIYHELLRKSRHERIQRLLTTKILQQKQKNIKLKEQKSGSGSSGGRNVKEKDQLTTIQRLMLEQEEQRIKNSTSTEQLEPLDGSDIAQPAPNPVFMGKTPSQYILSIIRVIKPADLHVILVSLPFDYAIVLLQILTTVLKQGNETELTTKCIFFILQIHSNQIITMMNASHIEMLQTCRDNMRLRIHSIRNHIGTNIAGLQFLQKYSAFKKQNENSAGHQYSLRTIAEKDLDDMLFNQGKSTINKKTGPKSKHFTTKAHKRQKVSIKRLKKKTL